MDASQRFKVLITGESGTVSWWNDRIGDEVYVHNFNQNTYIETSTERLIFHKDCHVIKPAWKVMRAAGHSGWSVDVWNRIKKEWQYHDIKNHGWFVDGIYRLAPYPEISEPKQPEYEPYTYEDRDKLRGLWISAKDKKIEMMIIGVEDSRVRTDGHFIQFYDLLKYYETAVDGKPVGKLKS